MTIEKSAVELTVKQQLLNLGMKETDFGTHASDLYVRVTDVSREFVKTYPFPACVKTFRSEVKEDNNALFYEISFGYMTEYSAGKSARK